MSTRATSCSTSTLPRSSSRSSRHRANSMRVRTDFANLKSNLKSLTTLVDLAQKNVDLKQHDVDRKRTLLAQPRRVAGRRRYMLIVALVTAQLQLQLGAQQQATTLNQLLGNPDLPIEQFPGLPAGQGRARPGAARPRPHRAESADRRHRDAGGQYPARPLRHRGHAGLQRHRRRRALGRCQPQGNRHHLSAARPEGRRSTSTPSPITALHGTVASVSPGTGAQFSILPPQNASGNWVKVVQRVPVRIVFDDGQDLSLLRAGMSVNVDIDTGRRRTLASLFGGRHQRRQGDAAVTAASRQRTRAERWSPSAP